MMKLDNIKFIGEEYKDEKEKEEKFNRLEKIKQDKLIFLNSFYDKEGTIKNMWSIYISHIYKHEKQLEKDCMFFSNIEVDEVIANRFLYAPITKKHILNFLSKYKMWGVSKGDISNNSVNAINWYETTKSMTNVLINKVWGLGEFYNLMVRIEAESELFNGIPLLLARYGITGKELSEMANLQWQDINYEKKEVKIIENGVVLRILDVDDRFIEWIDKYKKSLDSQEQDYGYVLKKNNASRDDKLTMSRHTIDSRIYRACDDLKITRISIGDLLKSRYLDILLGVRKDRKISIDDIEWVVMNFKNVKTYTMISNLKDFYEDLTKDKVILKNTANRFTEPLIDPSAKEFTEDLIEKIGYQEFVNVEEQKETKLENDFVDDEDDNYQKNVNKNIDENVDIKNHQYGKKEKDEYEGNYNSRKSNRNPSVGQLALKLANFQCELDETHKTFISNRTSKNYVEAHHIIPMKYYDEFKVSIDNEANIVALCPNCHREIHFGKSEAKIEMLRILYNMREEHLKKAEIEVEEKRLLEMYTEDSNNEDDN